MDMCIYVMVIIISMLVPLCADAREPVPHTATQVWETNKLQDSKVEQFLVVARYVGKRLTTFHHFKKFYIYFFSQRSFLISGMALNQLFKCTHFFENVSERCLRVRRVHKCT